MASSRIRNFLRGIQAIAQELETTLVDTLASIAPWLGPIAPAYIAYQAMVNVLLMPTWIAWVIALVVELLGISTINTAVQFWNYNQTRRSTDPIAPFNLAVIMAAFYLTIILVVNVLLDQAGVLDKTAKFLLSSLSPVAAVTLSLRAQHSRRLLDVSERKVTERRERQERKLLKVSQKGSEDKPEIQQVTASSPKYSDWRQVPNKDRLAIIEITKDKSKIMAMKDICQMYGVEERSAYNWIKKAEKLASEKQGGEGGNN